MSTLVADFPFDFTFPPTTPPSFSYDPSFLEVPYSSPHGRSNSQASIYSFDSSPSESFTDNASTRMTTPARSPIRTHGPLLLPKIRSQDSTIGTIATVSPPRPKRVKTSPSPASGGIRKATKARPTHARSFTNPESISFNANMFAQSHSMSMTTAVPMTTLAESLPSAQLLCSPVSFIQSRELSVEPLPQRRASSCGFDDSSADTFAYPTYRHMSPFMAAAPTTTGCSTVTSMQTQTLMPQSDMFYHQQQQQAFAPRESSPLASAAIITPEVAAPVDLGPTTTLMSYLTSANPAPALVRTISFPLRDPHTKHFWWDVRQVRPWTGFTASSIMSLPGASTLLSTSVPASLLPTPPAVQRHPETEAALHSIYSSHYLPKLNAALALSSTRPMQLSHPTKSSIAGGASSASSDYMFVANVSGEPTSAAAIFGGKPMGRIVGLVKSYDRFNTGMRVEGNIKRVEYLRGLAHLHHVMREHGCRYGFILTEIELVFVRNGEEGTPNFGFLEVGSTHLANHGDSGEDGEPTMTACLALWGLCMLASDQAQPGHAHWRSNIGAPAEGTRRKALPRDSWMPQPQLAEKREAKRTRGWVMPEDAIGRKELGKRGVRYGGC